MRYNLYPISYNTHTHYTSALSTPFSSGSILAALTTREVETREMACDILRDLIGLSLATTITWALITVMFRSAKKTLLLLEYQRIYDISNFHIDTCW